MSSSRDLIPFMFLSCLFAFVSDVGSQEALSVEKMVELALAQNADLIAARQRLAEAEGLLRQAGLRPNPSIDITVGNGDILNSDGERAFDFGYSHTFELGGKRSRRVEAAQKTYELVRSEIANRERLLASEVRIKYAEALAAIEKLKNADELFKLTSQTFDLAKARAQAGEAAPLEQGLLQVELNRISSDRMLFAAQVEQALLQARLLAGLPLDNKLQLSGTLERAVPAPDLDWAIRTAFTKRPDLAAARINEEVAEAGVRLALAGRSPDLVLRGGYAHAQAGFDQLGFSGASLVPLRDKDNILTAGISIVLPLSNRNQGNIAAARARKREAELARAALERTVRQEIMSAYQRLTAAQGALRVFDAGVIGQSRENLRIVRGAYELGELRMLDVINEQRRLIEIQRSYVDLLREAHVAAVEFERAAGVSGERR